MNVEFFGVRGSLATPSRRDFKSEKYGGNTSCVLLESDNGGIFILDAGTGLNALGNMLSKREFGSGNGAANIFLSHYHGDHMAGLPFFSPIFKKGNVLNFFGMANKNGNLEDAVLKLFDPQTFPVSIDLIKQIGAGINFHNLDSGVVCLDGVKVSFAPLNHPGGVLGYSFEENGKKVTYATDVESDSDGKIYEGFFGAFGESDLKLIKLAKQSDVLIADAQYTPEELYGLNGVCKKGWGHNTYERAIDLAIASNVKSKLVLFHHDNYHDDGQLDDLHERARFYLNNKSKYLPNLCSFDVVMAREGMQLEIQAQSDEAVGSLQDFALREGIIELSA